MVSSVSVVSVVSVAASDSVHGSGSHAVPAHVSSPRTIGSAVESSTTSTSSTSSTSSTTSVASSSAAVGASCAGVHSSVPSQKPPPELSVPSGAGGCQPSVSHAVVSGVWVSLATSGGSPRSQVDEPWRMATSMGGASDALHVLAPPAAAGIALSTSSTAPSGGPIAGTPANGAANGSWGASTSGSGADGSPSGTGSGRRASSSNTSTL